MPPALPLFALALSISTAASSAAAGAWPTPAPAGGGWTSVGNHRFRVDVAAGTAPGATVRAVVPWRRRDAFYGVADTFIVAAGGGASGPLVSRCFRNDSTLSATAATFTFTADLGAAPYYLYYLPFSTCEYSGGSCQYSADVSYSPRAHCADAPWWGGSAPPPAPAAAATYEAVSDFDAFTDMETPMSAAEFAGFLAAAAAVAPPPLGALLIAERANSSARLWGASYVAAAAPPPPPPPPPFCDYCAPCNAWFLKTGGVPSKRAGWDHGNQDKCCSTDAATCVWFDSEAECHAFDAQSCRVCGLGQDDVGCPSWASGGGGNGTASVPLPVKYLGRAPADLARLAATVAPNTNFSFQALVVTPANATATVVSVAAQPPAVPGVRVECFSTQGVDFWGRPFSPALPPAAGLLPLWLGAAVDRAAPAGEYNVTILVTLAGAGGANVSLPLTLELTVTGGAPLPDGGDAPPRVHWLNSRLGNDDASVPRPFTPLASNASTLPAAFSMHGKLIEVGASGLPAAITTYGASASPPVDALGSTAVLSPAGVSCAVAVNGGANLTFFSWTTTAFRGNGSAYEWAAAARDTSGAVELQVAGSVDATGYISIDVSLAAAALAPTDTLAFALVVPAAPQNAIYGMGLGIHGGRFDGLFPTPAAPSVDWRWDGVNGNNGVWLGSTTGGALLKLKGDDPLWQASVPYDSKAAPPAPASWSNGGAGGLRLSRDGVVEGFTGPFAAGANATRAFKASILVTPVHNLNLSHHFSLRYAQLDGPQNYTFLAEQGASVVNMHQGNIINPFINYPLLTNDLMRATATAVQGLGMRFSIYNTMRELSNRCIETFAMRAMGDGYVPGGAGGAGADWLKEHVGSDFLSAWSTPIAGLGDGFVTDAAMRVVALSRWNNFYIEAVQQMMRDFGLDGVYLDEIAYGRITMMRMKKLLDARGGVIDHHSDSGAFCVSPAMIYSEHYAYLDKLWYGEGFPYDTASPEYWLIEMSGLAFGLTAEMLRYPGMTPYHFKGMLFGEANRWQSGQDASTVLTDPFVPVALWRLWRDVDIASAALYGWWLEDTPLGTSALPVRAATASDIVKVTSFVLPTQAVIAVASFAPADVAGVGFVFNASLLPLPGGLSAAYCLTLPALPPFQPQAASFALNATFTVPKGQGFIFVLKLCG